uniref:Small integral membrane protein 5 n=1 Tax=Gasterosteus aculeatus aculeatus TaxID=481459 RepID=A0AAQ4RJ17_GASAC
VSMSEFKEEALRIVQKVWNRLQELPQASRLELGGFSVIILFVAMILFLMVLTCIHCCCCGKQKHQTEQTPPSKFHLRPFSHSFCSHSAHSYKMENALYRCCTSWRRRMGTRCLNSFPM